MNSALLKLENYFKKYEEKSGIVAFSGGVDSYLLMVIANKILKKTISITINSPLFSHKEISEINEIVRKENINHEIFDYEEPENSIFWSNPPDRCYICKKNIFNSLLEYKEKNNYDIIFEGTNASELSGHRPGYQALKELRIKSPYADLGITKKEIREIVMDMNISIAEKPSSACLASRIPYGTRITKEMLKQLAKGEALIRKAGYKGQLRLRWNQGNARIEVDHKDVISFENAYFNSTLIQQLKNLGFIEVQLDKQGYKPITP